MGNFCRQSYCRNANNGHEQDLLEFLMAWAKLIDLIIISRRLSILNIPNKESSCRARFLTLDKRILTKESCVLWFWTKVSSKLYSFSNAGISF